MATRPDPVPKRHWLRIFFVLPFIAMLWVSSYNRLTPETVRFPVLLLVPAAWVVISAAIAGIIYRAEH